ncbi:MAG TPA: hypothetical protein VGI03_08225 [Verrucomicrobiae bacterium]|jgi:hypothetical protein
MKKLILPLVLVAFTFCGCETTKDQLAGWKQVSGVSYLDNKAISDDVQKYIKHELPVDKVGDAPGGVVPWSQAIRDIILFEDGTGQHAVRISVDRRSRMYYFALIYDKSNVRVKVLKWRTKWYFNPGC